MHIFNRVLLVISLVLFVRTDTLAASYNVREFGAKGDTKHKDTEAIQSAIQNCHKAGGGVVYFPPGDYLSGQIGLSSNVTLHLESGAKLLTSREPNDYSSDNRRLIVADGAENIAITGRGSIIGIGQQELDRRPGLKQKHPSFRVGVIHFRDCKHIMIQDIQILFSDSWTVHLTRCEDVVIDAITILNNYYRINSDGIDPVSCKNVCVSNCYIITGDDSICLKSEDRPCQNVVVTNCVLQSNATAIKLGTASQDDFRDISFSNCVIKNSEVGIGFYAKDGGTIERVTFSNISIENQTTEGASGGNAVYPIFIDIEKRHLQSPVSKIRDINFNNIQIHTGAGILIQGMPESTIENLVLQNISMRVDSPLDYSDRKKRIGGNRTTKDIRDTLYAGKPSYLTLAHVNGLTVDNISVNITEQASNKYERSAFCGNEITNGLLRNIYRSTATGQTNLPVISLYNCRQCLITDCIAVPGTKNFVGLTGSKTAEIHINKDAMLPDARNVTEKR